MTIRKRHYGLFLILSVALIVSGGFFLDGKWSGIFIGLGSGLFGLSVAQLLMRSIIERRPFLEKRVEIESRDERNMQISAMAKAKAFDFNVPLAFLFFLTLIIAEVHIWIVLMAIGIFIVERFAYLWYLNKLTQDLKSS